MTTRRLGAAIGIATLVAAGSYVFVYLYRWEWNRALTSGLIFLAAEVALTTWLLNERLSRMGEELSQLRQERVRQRVHEAAPRPQAPFAWLTRTDRTAVFVPVLLGAGVLASAVAWLLERVARITAGPLMERSLVHRLSVLSPPPNGFLVGDDASSLLRRPQGH